MDNGRCQHWSVRTTPTRNWRGISAEERRTERHAALIEAGLEVIGTEGWANTTVRAVCRAAGLTERYFYEAFPEREALLVAVYDHVVTEGVAVVLEAMGHAPRDFRRTVRTVIAAGVRMLTEDRRKARILVYEATANQTLLRKRQQSIRDNAALLVAMSGTVFRTRAHESDSQLNALAAIGALVEIGTAYLDGGLDISEERLVEHLTGVVVAAAGVSSV